MTDMNFDVRPRTICKDGFSMSVQDNHFHYCTTGVTSEIGFPSEKVDELMKYAEDDDNPTETVYGHVPNKLVEKIIAKHGGRVESDIKPEAGE